MLCGNTQAEIDRDQVKSLAVELARIDDSEREPTRSMDELRYESIVYQNTVAALIAGATLTARDGHTKWSLPFSRTFKMTEAEINLEARVIASYVVG